MASHYSRKEEDLETLWKNNSTTGINFSKYERIPVHVEGDGKPRQVIRIIFCIFSMLNNDHHRPINTFDEAGFAPLLASNIRRATYKVPTPVQKYGIPIVKVNYCILNFRAVAFLHNLLGYDFLVEEILLLFRQNALRIRIMQFCKKFKKF